VRPGGHCAPSQNRLHKWVVASAAGAVMTASQKIVLVAAAALVDA